MLHTAFSLVFTVKLGYAWTALARWSWATGHKGLDAASHSKHLSKAMRGFCRNRTLQRLDEVYHTREALNLEAIRLMIPQVGASPFSCPAGCPSESNATLLQRTQQVSKQLQ